MRPEYHDEPSGPSPAEQRETRRVDLAMAEVPTLTDLVVGALNGAGWKILRQRNGRPGWALGSGFPDVFAVRGTEHLYAELKREDKDLEPKQKQWRDALLAAGFRWYLWKPSDWRTGRIQELIR